MRVSEKIVIIGNGIAALSAIKAFRSIDQRSEIYLFGDESFYPYNRIRLSKGLLEYLSEDKILLEKKEWYHENRIHISIDKKVSSLHTASHTVYFDDGTTIDYTKLLIASGARNAVPPIPNINKHGVFTLRNLEDSKKIIKNVKESKTILNIGGGIQGLETAWILSQAGKNVIVAELEERLMPKQLNQKASKLLREAMSDKNIKVMLGTQVSEITGKDKVEGFKTKDGLTEPCDMVLYAVGLLPNVDFVAETNLKVNRGIIVNDKMETSIKGIYAAGDAAEFNGQLYGLWNIAIEQGKTAGCNLAGRSEEYKHIVPVTTLNAFGLSLFSMGIVDEAASDYHLDEKGEGDRTYYKVFLKDNKVIGSIVLGNTKVSPIFKTAIENALDLGKIDFNNVSINELIEIIKLRK